MKIPDGIDQNKLLDWAMKQLGCKNDAALSIELQVTPSAICHIRAGRNTVGPLMLLRLHEITGAPTRKLRAIMGDDREFYDTGYYA